MPAILFGSISTLIDTSEIQRAAFNSAFARHGLDWEWDRDDYRAMLEGNGGADRIAEHARSVGASVDADAVHTAKSSIFQEVLQTATLSPRPGVVETIDAARGSGLKIGLVTTTSKANLAALFAALAPDVRASDFDVVIDSSEVERPKPDGSAYVVAMDRLGETPDTCVAVEDNVGGVRSATAAGLPCVAFPNENTAGHDFPTAEHRVDHLDIAELQKLIGH